jgi:hypothetical protein
MHFSWFIWMISRSRMSRKLVINWYLPTSHRSHVHHLLQTWVHATYGCSTSEGTAKWNEIITLLRQLSSFGEMSFVKCSIHLERMNAMDNMDHWEEWMILFRMSDLDQESIRDWWKQPEGVRTFWSPCSRLTIQAILPWIESRFSIDNQPSFLWKDIQQVEWIELDHNDSQSEYFALCEGFRVLAIGPEILFTIALANGRMRWCQWEILLKYCEAREMYRSSLRFGW